jgi:hypothetical protein
MGLWGRIMVNLYLGAFGAKFGLSTAAYFAEYSSTYLFRTKMKYVKYGDYNRNKATSFGLKSWSYGWLYSF